jgi:hypothetical protein
VIVISGLLVQTLGSLWFFEFTAPDNESDSSEVSYKVIKSFIIGFIVLSEHELAWLIRKVQIYQIIEKPVSLKNLLNIILFSR